MPSQPTAPDRRPRSPLSAAGTPAAATSPVAAALDPSWRPRYGDEVLPEQMPATPWPVVQEWLQSAAQRLAKAQGEAGAATLATVDAAGLPDARVVLVKEATPEWFRWYSDAGSAKAEQLQLNPQVALLFFWPTLHRQLRVRGVTQAVPAEVAAAYFASRPVQSQRAAAVSQQSRPLGSRAELTERVQAFAAEHAAGEAVPVPASWRGWDVLPVAVEFWTGDSNRLHDRVLYRSRSGGPANLADESQWEWGRLDP